MLIRVMNNHSFTCTRWIPYISSSSVHFTLKGGHTGLWNHTCSCQIILILTYSLNIQYSSANKFIHCEVIHAKEGTESSLLLRETSFDSAKSPFSQHCCTSTDSIMFPAGLNPVMKELRDKVTSMRPKDLHPNVFLCVWAAYQKVFLTRAHMSLFSESTSLWTR